MYFRVRIKVSLKFSNTRRIHFLMLLYFVESSNVYNSKLLTLILYYHFYRGSINLFIFTLSNWRLIRMSLIIIKHVQGLNWYPVVRAIQSKWLVMRVNAAGDGWRPQLPLEWRKLNDPINVHVPCSLMTSGAPPSPLQAPWRESKLWWQMIAGEISCWSFPYWPRQTPFDIILPSEYMRKSLTLRASSGLNEKKNGN